MAITAPAPMKGHGLDGLINWADPRPFAELAPWLNPDVWAAEQKMDGTRATLVLGELGNRFAGTRSEQFPQFATAVVRDLAGTVLDGEFVARNPAGSGPTLGHSTGLFNSGPAHAARVQKANGPARFYAFDVTHVQGESVMGHSYDDRRRHLEIVVTWIRQAHPGCEIYLAPRVELTETAIAKVIADGGEGVMLKRRASIYHPGKRSKDWRKVKALFTSDVVITGWRPGDGYNRGKVGSVEVSIVEADGSLRAVAHVGLKPAQRAAMTAPDGSLRPEYDGSVCEIAGHGVTTSGQVNLPIMLRLRPDKDASGCTADQFDKALLV